MKCKRAYFRFRKSKDKIGYGSVYCVYYLSTYKRTWFPLNIVITEKEWQTYANINYYFQTRMPTLNILYYKFADFLDKVLETVNESDSEDAKLNVQKLMMRMCTHNL